MARSKHTPAASGGKWLRASLRWAIYYRDDFVCVYCERIGKLSIDHRVSTKSGGRDHRPQNLVTSCHGCNSTKKSLSSRAWYAKLRASGIDTNRMQRRIARLVRRAVDRQVGRFLANAMKSA